MLYVFVMLVVGVFAFQEPALDQVTVGDNPDYSYVGCHVVGKNPDRGNAAFGPFGVKTPVIFFKQKSNDGTTGEVTTAVPC